MRYERIGLFRRIAECPANALVRVALTRESAEALAGCYIAGSLFMTHERKMKIYTLSWGYVFRLS